MELAEASSVSTRDTKVCVPAALTGKPALSRGHGEAMVLPRENDGDPYVSVLVLQCCQPASCILPRRSPISSLRQAAN